jgi:cobalt-zinc-cadmium efflux system membrane fusion protein
MEREDRQVSERQWARSGRSRVVRALAGGLLAIGLVALGVAAGVWGERRNAGGGSANPAPQNASPPQGGPAMPGMSAAPAATPSPADPAGDVEVLLPADALAKVGIKTSTIAAVDAGASVQVPGSIMPNAYREVKVTPIVGGIVIKVSVGLGDTVRRGDPVVVLFSAELADAQTKYLSMAAMLEADHRKLERTQQLVEIGAASRQELEETTAVHTSHETEVESARQRLLQLGLTRSQMDALKSSAQVVSTVSVPAPIDGVITSRTANLGQVVAMGQELVVVTDLSNVWIIGDLYEQDFQTVQVGSEATITTPVYANSTFRGRVAYIDPRVDAQARTAKVRVEVPNRDGRLRLGMYVSMVFTTRGKERALVVPRAAVQALGERMVVYIPVKDEEGKFIQRQIRVGQTIGDGYTVLGGLQAGDVVVTEGSFFLRAESLRNSPSG